MTTEVSSNSRLAAIVAAKTKDVKKKTYNNIVSVVRTYFKFGYKDHPGKFNPALALPGFRMTAKDRPKVDPFAIRKAELIIAASHREPFVNTFLPYRRWTEVLETLPLRYRKPYNSRHAFISWRLMVGHNRLLVAQDDGHSVAMMERPMRLGSGVQSQKTSSGSKLRWQADR
jgi:hypothetical protein